MSVKYLSVFLLRLRVQTHTQTWGCVHSESCVMASHAFKVGHHINFLNEVKHVYPELSINCQIFPQSNMRDSKHDKQHKVK